MKLNVSIMKSLINPPPPFNNLNEKESKFVRMKENW